MNTIIFICGYANSGKSSLLDKSKYPSTSTSVVLDFVAARVEKYILGSDQPLDILSNRFKTKEIAGSRGKKIALAEGVLIPIFGRSLLVEKALSLMPEGDVILFESIGGEELQLAQQIAYDLGYLTLAINVRHPEELKGVDIRELALAGVEFQNSFDEGSLIRFEELISKMCQDLNQLEFWWNYH